MDSALEGGEDIVCFTAVPRSGLTLPCKVIQSIGDHINQACSGAWDQALKVEDRKRGYWSFGRSRKTDSRKQLDRNESRKQGLTRANQILRETMVVIFYWGSCLSLDPCTSKHLSRSLLNDPGIPLRKHQQQFVWQTTEEQPKRYFNFKILKHKSWLKHRLVWHTL